MSLLFRRTSILTFSLFLTIVLVAQEVPKGWQNLDKSNGYYGISTDKAYEFLKSKKLKSQPVIVAVIDSGVDTTQEDLKPILWTNSREIPGNGVDDDKNGYVDDIYGWNFLGSRDGSQNVEQDSYESARVFHRLKSKWQGKTVDVAKLSKEDKYEYLMWKRSERELGIAKASLMEVMQMKQAYLTSRNLDSMLRKVLGKDTFTGKDLQALNSDRADINRAKSIFLSLMELTEDLESTNTQFLESFGDYVNSEVKKAESASTPPKEYRNDVVKDNYNDLSDRFYGNGNVTVSNKSALHGTHVAGIIAAARNNGKGINGIADNVKIMSLRVIPDGDEHDKDIALAIKYAVDNGARIINMSFGKSFSPEKAWVDEAARYAESRGVLIVQAAGNEGKNIDTTYNFPIRTFLKDGKTANNWIMVGASGPNNTKPNSLSADFSNFGKQNVDVFAPGVKIYSTQPGNNYGSLDGTSFSSPVVSGIAALILSYYPALSPQQIKYAIEKSVVVPGEKVLNPATGDYVSLNELSKYGGIANAYEAVKLASTLKPEQQPQPSPKSSVSPKIKGTP